MPDQQLKILTAVKMELKLTDDLDYKLQRIIRQVITRILDFCNRGDLPPVLEDMVVSIVEDILKADGTVKTEQDVSSISRGDTSISYREKSKSQAETIDFMKNYESQLIKHKKIRLPKII